ncbi:MAG TPA: hypothetical protein VJ085_09840 [Candidatus Acidoferrales bacterium]|nr:hypothetical protein [Candidatus Acidoferrales bacterium]
MAAELVPEDYSRRTEPVGDYTVAIISYRLGSVYHAKAEIHIPGAGARLAAAQDSDRNVAEEKVLAEARRLIEKKN